MFQFTPIGVIRSCFREKFGIPRQPGLAPAARATLELSPPYGQAAAVRGLTQSVAVYCHKAGKGVRCNSVHPDGIVTPMTMEMAEKAAGMNLSDPARSRAFVCQPQEVAKLVLFLASDDSRHINGAAMTIDNGSTITPPYV